MIRKFFQIIDDWLEEDANSLYGLFKVLCTVTSTCIVGVGIVAGFITLISGPDQTISLDKRDWHCTATRTELVPVPVGKALIPEPRTVCTTWERNQ